MSANLFFLKSGSLHFQGQELSDHISQTTPYAYKYFLRVTSYYTASGPSLGRFWKWGEGEDFFFWRGVVTCFFFKLLKSGNNFFVSPKRPPTFLTRILHCFKFRSYSKSLNNADLNNANLHRQSFKKIQFQFLEDEFETAFTI